MIAELTAAAFPLADTDWHHMDGGWWVVMVFGMMLFWALVVVGVIWLVRELGGRGGRPGREPDALALLDRRLAEGTISPDDYRERRAILTGLHPPAGGGSGGEG